MLPRYHAGDLVILRKEPSYHVGEVAAYHNEQLHAIVLHRIVAIRGTRYVFKGDNNSWVTTFEPTKSQIVGARWLHLPEAGRLLLDLRTPIVAALLLGVLWLYSFWSPSGSRRRRRRHRHGRRHRVPNAHALEVLGENRRARPLCGRRGLFDRAGGLLVEPWDDRCGGDRVPPDGWPVVRGALRRAHDLREGRPSDGRPRVPEGRLRAPGHVRLLDRGERCPGGFHRRGTARRHREQRAGSRTRRATGAGTALRRKRVQDDGHPRPRDPGGGRGDVRQLPRDARRLLHSVLLTERRGPRPARRGPVEGGLRRADEVHDDLVRAGPGRDDRGEPVGGPRQGRRSPTTSASGSPRGTAPPSWRSTLCRTPAGSQSSI